MPWHVALKVARLEFCTMNFEGHNHEETFEETVEIHEYKQALKGECIKLEMNDGHLKSVGVIYNEISAKYIRQLKFYTFEIF